MLDVREIRPPARVVQSAGLPKIDFADGYCGQLSQTGILARDAARAIFHAPPRVALALMSLRNRVVSVFGLKTPVPAKQLENAVNQIGIFPVLSESSDIIVLGMDDKHLDFRVCVVVQPQDAQVSLSTLICIHNLFGRLYLLSVLPFHKLLSRYMLRRALRNIASRRTTAPE